MPKVDFQERGSATVKVFGRDLAAATTPGTATGPQGFPPPPPVPPPPPPPITVVEVTGNVAQSILRVRLSAPIAGVDPFAQSHPWTIDTSAGPSFPNFLYDNAGANTMWAWSWGGPYDAPVTLTVPALSELQVVAGTFPVTVT